MGAAAPAVNKSTSGIRILCAKEALESLMMDSFFLLSSLHTNSNADRNNEDGNSKFMKDAERTVDMSINFQGKHVW